jgi:hypothetical protein
MLFIPEVRAGCQSAFDAELLYSFDLYAEQGKENTIRRSGIVIRWPLPASVSSRTEAGRWRTTR